MILLLAFLLLGDNIPDPVCQPWQTIMHSSYKHNGESEWTTTAKWCDTDSSKGFPRSSDIIRNFLNNNYDFDSNYWHIIIDPKPYSEITGDCYEALYHVTYHNINNIPPYPSTRAYRIRWSDAGCSIDSVFSITEEREP